MAKLSAIDARFLRMAYEEALAGFNEGGAFSYGAAFVLGATSNDMTTGNGYAVIIGNANSTILGILGSHTRC